MSWIGNGIIPNIDWLKWSYGAPEPDGFFVVPALLQRFRQERSHSAICRGAGISLSTLIDYRKRAEEALTVALKGDLSALARVPCWRKLDGRTRDCMLRLAKSSSMHATCRRANDTKAKGAIQRIYQSLRDCEALGLRTSWKSFSVATLLSPTCSGTGLAYEVTSSFPRRC